MTFQDVLKQTGELHETYVELGFMWNGDVKHGENATYPIVVIVKVLLNNMCYAKTFEEYQKLFKVLERLNEYNSKCYMTHFAYLECYYLVESYVYLN